MNELEKAIINTVAYFDVFDYPLTDFEIWQWLYFDQPVPDKIDYSEIRELLNKDGDLQTKLEFKDGYYFLSGRSEIIHIRRQRYAYAERKYLKTMRVIRWLRFFPFIKMIAVCNTLAFNNSRREADIDLFIITKPGRVWQTRFWVNGFLKLFKLRPSREKMMDTICSTFFVDADHLNLRHLMFDKNDIYMKYWTRQLIPIYDEGFYDMFFRENNWVCEFLPNALRKAPPRRRRVKKVKLIKIFFNAITSILPEQIFKNYQLKIMPRGLKEMANQDTRVVVNDHMLKFHDNDRRQQFLTRWETTKQKIQ